MGAQASLTQVTAFLSLTLVAACSVCTVLASVAMADSKVKEMGEAEFGRKELTLAGHEMPGLMAARKEYGPAQPFKGLNINGSLLKSWKETKAYKNDVYLLPKILDEKVASLHLP